MTTSEQFLNEIKPDLNVLRERYVGKTYGDMETDFFMSELPDGLDADCYMDFHFVHDTIKRDLMESRRTHTRYLVIFTDADGNEAYRLFFNFKTNDDTSEGQLISINE